MKTVFVQVVTASGHISLVNVAQIVAVVPRIDNGRSRADIITTASGPAGAISIQTGHTVGEVDQRLIHALAGAPAVVACELCGGPHKTSDCTGAAATYLRDTGRLGPVGLPVASGHALATPKRKKRQ